MLLRILISGGWHKTYYYNPNENYFNKQSKDINKQLILLGI